jgi:hypothetical protein
VSCVGSVFLENAIRDAVSYTKHARRKMMTALDVIHVPKRKGHQAKLLATGSQDNPNIAEFEDHSPCRLSCVVCMTRRK